MATREFGRFFSFRMGPHRFEAMEESNKERNMDRLAGWIMKLGVLALICAVCWYFRSVLVYVLVAFVVSLLDHLNTSLMGLFPALGPDIEAENTSSLI